MGTARNLGLRLALVTVTTSCLPPAAVDPENAKLPVSKTIDSQTPAVDTNPFVTLLAPVSTTTKPPEDTSSLDLNGFLTKDELAHSIEAPAIYDIEKRVNAEAGFLNSAPSRVQTRTNNCYIQNPVVAKGNKLILQIETQSTDCNKFKINGPLPQTRRLKHKEVISCETTELKAFDQKRLSLDDTVFNLCNGSGSLLQNTRSEETYVKKLDGEDIKHRSKSIFFIGNESGGGCSQHTNNGVTVFGLCVLVHKVETSKSGAENTAGMQPAHFYSRLTYKGLSGRAGERFFRSGTIEFQLDNWKGTMTYTDPTTPPTWTATSGKSTRSGTYGKITEE